MIALGIDPDTKDCAVAAWNVNGPMAVQVIHVIRRKTNKMRSQVLMARALARTKPEYLLSELHVTTIAIEGQQIDKRLARSKDLFTLAHVTGSAISWCTEWWGVAEILVPTPYEWKRGVAKHAHQARLYHELDWGYTIVGNGTNKYARPLNIPIRFRHITDGQWKHVGDALLLARWAYEQA